MSKPLTIEQLKALEVGDWVWIELKDKFTLKCNDVIYDYKCSNKSLYFQVANACDNVDRLTLLTPYEDYSLFLSYSDYSKTWLAYKNKEQAEGEYDSRAVENEVLKRDKENLERTLEEINTALYGANIIIDSDGNIHDKRVEEAKKQTAKEILQEVWNTGGTILAIKQIAQKYGVEVEE